MTKGLFRIVAALVLLFIALGIGALVLFPVPWKAKKNRDVQQTRIIIPKALNTRVEDADTPAELMAREEAMAAKLALDEGEVIVSVLNGNFGGNPMDEQFLAYRNLLEIESPIYLTYIHYDEASQSYKRVWNAPTAATRPGTISLYTLDLLGDRSVCVLLSGMNSLGEHTLTVFRLNPVQAKEHFSKIAELRIDGNITVRETERSQAYQMGFSRGQSFTIAAYGRDFESSNILDQVEIVYAYNTGNGLFEQNSRTRIPGTQIEQRRVRELLGNPRAFEEFITGLWYFMTPKGTIDMRQYIFFSPANREIIFYGDETQQVFTWQNSNATRYGLYISSQNISVTTLRRSIDIELESLDGIKVRVFEDVRLKIGVNAPWDGSYRKAGPPENREQKTPAARNAYINAYYDSSIGRIHFMPNGSYELNAGGTLRQGKYAFFTLNNEELLELRFDSVSGGELRPSSGSMAGSAAPSGPVRETYLVSGPVPEQAVTAESPPGSGIPAELPLRKTLTLLRVRIGAKGIERLHESSISLTLASE